MELPDQRKRNTRILIIDDQAANIQFFERLLARAGYRAFESVTDPREAIGRFRAFEPDLVLLDLLMPRMDGFAVLDRLRDEVSAESYLPILVLTADSTEESRQRALAGGAKDFLTKPLDVIETLLRIENLLETRHLHRQLERHKERLEHDVLERTKNLRDAQMETVERLARAAEYRDDQTGDHARRVGTRSAAVAVELGLSDDDTQRILRAAQLHDVGKIGIPDRILLKPGNLSSGEFEIMKSHTTMGAHMLSGSHSPLLHMAEEIALTHHERWDGRGYPEGLEGEEIPLVGRIVAVVDVLDALTHDRPYKEAWTMDDALAEIERVAGRDFDPTVVAALLRVREDGVLDDFDIRSWPAVESSSGGSGT